MRVVLDGRFIQDHFPGIARYTYHLARSLAKLGDGPLDLLVDPWTVNRRYDLAGLSDAVNLRLRPVAAPVFRPTGMLQVMLALSRLGADVYHSPYYLVPPWTPGRLVTTVFDVTSARFGTFLPSRSARLVYNLATSWALRRSRRVIVPSANTGHDLVTLHHASPAKLATIPLGVDARFVPASGVALSAIRRRYCLPSRFILYLGINKPHKNLPRLVEAFARADLPDDVSLVLAGREDQRYPTGRTLARTAGVADRVICLGDVAEADLPALYSAATLFAFPSLYEGFGLPPLEAMACGTPVICSRASSLPEVVGEAGLLCDPLDVGDLARALMIAFSDDALRWRLAEAGLARSRQFTWESAALATWKVYQDVATC